MNMLAVMFDSERYLSPCVQPLEAVHSVVFGILATITWCAAGFHVLEWANFELKTVMSLSGSVSHPPRCLRKPSRVVDMNTQIAEYLPQHLAPIWLIRPNFGLP